MDIHFVRGGPSYLPELDAYREHIAGFGWGAIVHDTGATVPADARVVWWICGRVPGAQARRLGGAFHVHEYASASVPPHARAKDVLKRWLQPRPHHRVFQNTWVRDRIGFSDGVPHTLRDMGVPRSFLATKAGGAPEFDLVYLGETSRLAAFLPALAALLEAHLSLLVVGSVAAPLQALLAKFANVRCIGRVPQAEVPAQLLRARAGLNLMPPQLPFTEQTSTKVLEYLAVGLPVISNDYAWARHIAAQFPGRVHITPGLDAAGWRTVMRGLPDVRQDRSELEPLTWPERLRDLAVWDAIREHVA